MNFVFIAFLLLCTIPLQVQLVTICDRLHFYKHFKVTFKKLYHGFQTVYGLNQVARQCHQLHVPKHRLKRITRRSCQPLTQTLPPSDEYIPASKTRPILIHYTALSPLLTPPTSQRIPAPQQDQAGEELRIEITSQPSTSTEDRSLDNETPISQVKPLLGTTHRENLQLRDRN